MLATIALNEFLHRSKEPDILFWSTKKLAFCLGVIIASTCALWASKKLAVPDLPKPLEHTSAPGLVFLTLSCLWFVLHLGKPPEVGGDIQYQMLAFRQYLEEVLGNVREHVLGHARTAIGQYGKTQEVLQVIQDP